VGKDDLRVVLYAEQEFPYPLDGFGWHGMGDILFSHTHKSYTENTRAGINSTHSRALRRFLFGKIKKKE
jgi:hypothetical protein